MIKPFSLDFGRPVKINVTLKNGVEYLGKDIPECPFDQNYQTVSFWNDGSIRVILMSEVKWVDLYEDADDEKDKSKCNSGEHLRVARTWIQSHFINGQDVMWGSDDILEVTVKEIEGLAEEIAKVMKKI